MTGQVEYPVVGRRTFTTAHGHRVTTSARKLYVLVRSNRAGAEVVFRTNDFGAACALARRAEAAESVIWPDRSVTHLYRKRDGARLVGWESGRPEDLRWLVVAADGVHEVRPLR